MSAMKFAITLTFILSIHFQSFAKKAELSFEVLATPTFENMPEDLRKEYVQEIRKTWVEFENIYNNKNAPVSSVWKNIFIETANAADQMCIVGGNLLTAINNNGKFSCPTRTKPCKDEMADGFRCGAIFGEKCIDRNPIADISKRCLEAAPSTALKKTEYERMLKNLAVDFNSICNEKSAIASKDGCKFLATKFNRITKDYNVKIAGLEEYNSNKNKKNSIQPGMEYVSRDTPAQWMGGYGVKIPGCPNEKGSAVPKFVLKPDAMCAIENNPKILANLVQKGCSNVKDANNLFTTSFKTNDRSILMGESNKVDTIVEKIGIQEKRSSNDITYEIQVLKPMLNTKPVSVGRENILLRKKDNTYYLVDKERGETEVSVYNGYRPNFLIESSGITTNYHTYMDGRAQLASNCLLAGHLKNKGYYSATSSSNVIGGSK